MTQTASSCALSPVFWSGLTRCPHSQAFDTVSPSIWMSLSSLAAHLNSDFSVAKPQDSVCFLYAKPATMDYRARAYASCYRNSLVTNIHMYVHIFSSVKSMHDFKTSLQFCYCHYHARRQEELCEVYEERLRASQVQLTLVQTPCGSFSTTIQTQQLTTSPIRSK